VFPPKRKEKSGSKTILSEIIGFNLQHFRSGKVKNILIGNYLIGLKKGK